MILSLFVTKRYRKLCEVRLLFEKREWLKDYREAQNLKHKDVARLSNIERAYYTMIENGTRTPSPKVAKDIGNALGFNWTIFFED